jgi:tetratricopeptide (TPR) repeat protein
VKITAFVLGLLLTAAAHAQQSLLDTARAALARGDVAAAEAALSAVVDAPDRNDFDFLRGTLAVRKGDYEAAIIAFRAILTRDATLNRVRLDLAQAYFLKGDDVAALFHFRAALAQGVPPEVMQNVTTYLNRIAARKRWTVDASLAVAPDSNINAATTSDTVDIFGLPFVLDPTAQRRSAVGAALSLDGSYRFALNNEWKLKSAAAFYGTAYGASAFNDRRLSAEIGPAYAPGADLEVVFLAAATRRWLGGDRFTTSAGLRIEGQKVLSSRWAVAAAAAWENRTYDSGTYADYTGPVYTAFTAATTALDAQSVAQFTAGVVRERARAPSLRARQYIAGLSYSRENIWRGFGVAAAFQAAAIRYDAPLLAFGTARRDTQVDYRLSLSNAMIDVWGFAPVLSLIHSDRYSNISLFEFHRIRGEFGVKRSF